MFKELRKVYKDTKREIDALGNSNTLRRATKTLLKDVVNVLDLLGTTITIKDIRYLDGYFIFAKGSNSVVHFRVKELPGWKFGIWWNTHNDRENDFVSGEFFAQWEDEIDKFKPSASEICYEFKISLNDTDINSIYDIIKNFEWMIKHPYSAFYLEYTMEDAESEEAAKKFFDEYCAKRAFEQNLSDTLDKKVLDYVRDNALPIYNGARIRKSGWTSPKYEVIAKYSRNKHMVPSRGLYDMFNDPEDLVAWEKEVDDCKKIANENGIYWHCPIQDTILFTGSGR